jgi:hypothetical protein
LLVKSLSRLADNADLYAADRLMYTERLTNLTARTGPLTAPDV